MNLPFPPALPGSVIAPPSAPVPIQPVSDVQRMFAREYVKDFKTAKAAVRVGMSASWGAAQLQDPRIVALINENKRRHQETVDIAVDATLENLATFTRVSVADYFVEKWIQPPTPLGAKEAPPKFLVLELVPPSEWSDDMKAACKKMKQNKDGAWEIEVHDKLAANVQIGRFLDMFTDTTKVVGPNGGPVQMITPTMSPEDAARAYADTLKGNAA